MLVDPIPPRRRGNLPFIILTCITVIALVVAGLAWAGVLGPQSRTAWDSVSRVTQTSTPSGHGEATPEVTESESLAAVTPGVVLPTPSMEDFCVAVTGPLAAIPTVDFTTLTTEQLKGWVRDLRDSKFGAPSDLTEAFTTMSAAVDQIRLAQQVGDMTTHEVDQAVESLNQAWADVAQAARGICS